MVVKDVADDVISGYVECRCAHSPHRRKSYCAIALFTSSLTSRRRQIRPHASRNMALHNTCDRRDDSSTAYHNCTYLRHPSRWSRATASRRLRTRRSRWLWRATPAADSKTPRKAIVMCRTELITMAMIGSSSSSVPTTSPRSSGRRRPVCHIPSPLLIYTAL
jgi:hypothetical protein